LLRRVIRSWLQYLTDVEEEVQKLWVHFLQKKIFRAWFNMVREAKIDSQNKREIAVEHHDRRTLWITFETWKKFVWLAALGFGLVSRECSLSSFSNHCPFV